jgi:hypothetical protein
MISNGENPYKAKFGHCNQSSLSPNRSRMSLAAVPAVIGFVEILR